MRMSRRRPRLGVSAAVLGWLALGLIVIGGQLPCRAQTSLFDARFDEVRRASVEWDRRNGPEREVVDLVCLVPDVPTFLKAIAAWDERHCFPILIDDVPYTLKFLRAFRPARVVRYPAKAEAIAPGELWKAAVTAVGKSWSSDGEPQGDAPVGDAVPKFLGLTPPGIVVSAPDSTALAGAVALAAGRFHPLLKWETSQKFADMLSYEDALATARSLESVISERGFRYDQLGDDCDFVTLAGNYPYRYGAPGRERMHESKGSATAFDDLILRAPQNGKRWAFAGRLTGDPTASVFRAMCSLFLHPKTSLMFNGYNETAAPWSAYSMATAAARTGRQLSVTHRSGDRATIAGWHQAFDPLNRFGLVMINSSGSPTYFDLQGGRGNTADVPEGGPSAVVIIHSFSAESPEDRETIAGRWLANGAFIYFGSMNEPYLDSFRTPGLVATFLGENLPLVASVRRTGVEPFGDPWRLVYFGDPLYRLKSTSPDAGRVADWNAVAEWPAYVEFRRPAADAPAGVRLNWALKTAIFLLQTGTVPRQRNDVAEVLLSISREKLDSSLKPIYDELLVSTLLNANRAPELLERLMQIPVAERYPGVKLHLETVQMSALQRYAAAKDLRQAVALWQEVMPVHSSRDFGTAFTERTGQLANTPARLNEWRTRLRTVSETPLDPSNRAAIELELKRVDEKLASLREAQ